MEVWDCIVIGGGSSGLMASITSTLKGTKTLLIEKGNKVGHKLSITGGGRCNVTNTCSIPELIKHLPGNGRFLHSALAQFNNIDLINFLKKIGVDLKEEEYGRVFPQSNNAQTIITALTKHLIQNGGSILTNTIVTNIELQPNNQFIIFTNDQKKFYCKKLIIATGGKSVPKTGSTGDGYLWAQKMGHTITTLYPAEVPLISNEPFIQTKQLQGISLKKPLIGVLNQKGKITVTHNLDIIFTHFGLSGPGILRTSSHISPLLTNGNKITIVIDCLPHMSIESLNGFLQTKLKVTLKKNIKHVFKNLFPTLPERYLLFLLAKSGIDPDKICSTITQKNLTQLLPLFKKLPVKICATLPIERGFTTGGGVSTKEIYPKSMESKIQRNLFFCGEIIDIHGYTGGYNLTAAFVTGHIAGLHAGKDKNG